MVTIFVKEEKKKISTKVGRICKNVFRVWKRENIRSCRKVLYFFFFFLCRRKYSRISFLIAKIYNSFEPEEIKYRSKVHEQFHLNFHKEFLA